jgi:dienelactone hydrolase
VNRTRALLLATAVPLLIVLGMLVSALGGSSGGSPPALSGPVESGGRQPTAAGAHAGGTRGTGGAAGTSGGATQETSAPRAVRSFVAGSQRVDVGSGPRGAAIFRPRVTDRDAPVVVFLHGWGAVDPERYGSWIAHLVHGGATVIYPTYQEPPFLDTVSPLPNTLVALRLALEQVRVAPGRLVVAGHSAGGALAADYAASARTAGLPVPAAVFSVYPGRSLDGIALRIPTVSARKIAAGTRVLALAGADDRVVGSRVARTIVRTAARARATLRIVRDPRVDDHGAPGRSDPAVRRTFWAPLDRLIAATR